MPAGRAEVSWHSAASRATSRYRRRAVALRAAVTLAAAALLIGAETTAILSTSRAHHLNEHFRRRSRPVALAVPYGGEPHISSAGGAGSGPWVAAARFVRDYDRWSDGQLSTVPPEDATARVIRLLDRQDRAVGVELGDVATEVRIAPTRRRTYVVTSPVGNFLVGRSDGRWLVVSLPGY